MESDPFPTQDVLAQAAWAQRVARAMVRDEHLAEDIAQDALEASLRRKTAPQGGLQAWLYGTLRNLRRQAARKEGNLRRRELGARPAEPQAKPDELLERVEVQRAVIDAVIRLPEILRSALILRYYEDLSVREVARTLGVTEKAAELRIQRGIQQLRESFASRFGASWVLTVAPLLHAPAAAIPATLAETLLMTAKSKFIVAGACALLLMGTFVAFNGLDADPVLDSPEIAASTTTPAARPDAGTLEDPVREAVDAQETAPEALVNLRVEVRAAIDDEPLAQAEILLSDKLLGTSDATGRFAGSWPDQVDGGKLSVHRAGFLPWESEVAPQTEPFRVALVRTGVIHGRLVSADGNVDWTDMSVLAHPADGPVDRAAVASALAAGDPAVKRVKTDPSGWFEVRDLPADRLYHLHAGGAGWISPQARLNVPVGGVEVEVKVRKLFGAHLSIRAADGRLLRVNEKLYDETPVGMRVPESGTSDFLDQNAVAVLLLPFPMPEPHRTNAHDRWYLFCLEGDEPEPLPIGIVVAGYKPVTSAVQLQRLRTGIPRQEIRLEALTGEWGRIVVQLEGLPDCLPEELPAVAGSMAPHLILHLQPLNLPRSAHQEFGLSRQWPFRASISDPRLESFELPGVPAASYRAGWRHRLDNLSMLPGEDTLELQDLIVWPGQTSKLVLDFSQTGAVRILSRAGEPPLRGWLHLQIGTPDGQQDRIYFPGFPYLIYGLTPGIYRFARGTNRPLPQGAPQPEMVEVEVRKGSWTEVRLPPP